MTRNNRRRRDSGRDGSATDAPGAASARATAGTRPGGRGEVRIIGGCWRGRRLQFPRAPSLRPTPDRVRETLFNWLQFEIAGRRCLDLFAGSGVLGFEALSRGASAVVFVDDDPAAVAAIRASLQRFASDRACVEPVDAFSFLARGCAGTPFDIVFLDPPYEARCLGRACAALEAGRWLAPGAFVYLEDDAARGVPCVPPGWTLLRSRKAGEVGYHLARRGEDTVAHSTTTAEPDGVSA